MSSRFIEKPAVDGLAGELVGIQDVAEKDEFSYSGAWE
jgi:hypothetical protein